MKATLFVLACLAVSGFAASLTQESPKFLAQADPSDISKFQITPHNKYTYTSYL